MKTILKARPLRRIRRREENCDQRGVALVITLLMLVVITTMAVAFLLLSQRETASVSALHSTTNAENASSAALERAKAQTLAPFLDPLTGTNEVMGPDFTVSMANTNWPDPLAVDVGPPVIVNTNRPGFSGPLDNRFFLDLNRNDYFEESGPYVDVTDDRYATTGQKASLMGDPMWIGMRQDSKKPYGKDNYYIARYCYLIQPIGRSLDLNWIHNDAVNRVATDAIGYFRNQGVGPWELNLAAFLADGNPSVWNTNAGPVSNIPYQYSTNWNPAAVQATVGDAFKDARWLLLNRLNTDKYNALSVPRLFGVVGDSEFATDLTDGFSNGPLLPWGRDVSFFGAASDLDNPAPFGGGVYDSIKPWPGADSPRHYFTPQELFDADKYPSPGGGQADFRDRLRYVSNKGNSGDRYTFYRMLSQLGTDSAPEKDNRIDLNYINVGGVPASALISWNNRAASLQRELTRANVRFTNGFTDRYGVDGPEIFLNVTVERLLQEDGYNFTNANPLIQPFQIPVYTNGSPYFVGVGKAMPLYTSRLNQMVQMAANILEATTAQKTSSDAVYPYYPYVFRPVFLNSGGNIYITRYIAVDDANAVNTVFSGKYKWYDLTNRTVSLDDNFYDIPWIFGARKGLPSFNEFSLQTHVFFKRYLQFEKSPATGLLTKINQALLVGVTNYCFTEFASSFTNYYNASQTYPRRLVAYATNEMTVTVLVDSNVLAVANVGDRFIGDYPRLTPTNQIRVSTMTGDKGISSFVPTFVSPPNVLSGTNKIYDTVQRPYTNQWVVKVENRLRCYVFDVDDSSNQRLVDAFTSSRMSLSLDVNKTLDQGDNEVRQRLWDIRLGGTIPHYSAEVTRGVQNQFEILTGKYQLPANNDIWNNYLGLEAVGYATRTSSIAKFNAWLSETNKSDLIEDSPFNPSRTVVHAGSWQANDPAVHYTIYDLINSQFSNTASNWFKPGESRDAQHNVVVEAAGSTLGGTNKYYKPWGRDNNSYVIGAMDPMVQGSDSWEYPSQFAAGKYPNVGWLGRVHRGTPWQTIYFKAEDPAMAPTPIDQWRNYVGEAFMPALYPSNYLTATTMFPTNDWRLLDIFTVAVHPNVTRGKLSINQTNPAAWSALFSGIGVTTAGNPNARGEFEPLEAIVQPASVDQQTTGTNTPPLSQLVERINAYRSSLTNLAPPLGRPVAQFSKLSDLLAVDFLTIRSPFLTPPYISQEAENSKHKPEFLLADADYERIPQQIAGLVKVGEPRYVIYAWGQSLKPAGNVQGLGFGIDASTKVPRNYQVTGEMATRAVVKIEYERDALGQTNRFRPRAVIESFNILPTD